MSDQSAAPVGASDADASTPGTADPDRELDLFDPRIDHTVAIVDRGAFAVSVCRGCGWESFARRSRPLARSEGHDHELLFSRPWS